MTGRGRPETGADKLLLCCLDVLAKSSSPNPVPRPSGSVRAGRLRVRARREAGRQRRLNRRFYDSRIIDRRNGYPERGWACECRPGPGPGDPPPSTGTWRQRATDHGPRATGDGRRDGVSSTGIARPMLLLGMPHATPAAPCPALPVLYRVSCTEYCGTAVLPRAAVGRTANSYGHHLPF